MKLLVISHSAVVADYQDRFSEVPRTPKSFLICIEKSLHDDNPELRKRRITFARDNSWEQRMQVIQKAIEVARKERQNS